MINLEKDNCPLRDVILPHVGPGWFTFWRTKHLWGIHWQLQGDYWWIASCIGFAGCCILKDRFMNNKWSIFAKLNENRRIQIRPKNPGVLLFHHILGMGLKPSIHQSYSIRCLDSYKNVTSCLVRDRDPGDATWVSWFLGKHSVDILNGQNPAEMVGLHILYLMEWMYSDWFYLISNTSPETCPKNLCFSTLPHKGNPNKKTKVAVIWFMFDLFWHMN